MTTVTPYFVPKSSSPAKWTYMGIPSRNTVIIRLGAQIERGLKGSVIACSKVV